MILAPSDPALRVLIASEEDPLEDSSVEPLERIELEDEDLACGPAGQTGPWRLTEVAGGRQLNDRDFAKPLEVDWRHFSIGVMREVLATDACIHFNLTNMQGLPDLLEGEGEWGETITAYELRWLRQRWDRGDSGIVFWTDVEYRADGAWGRRVEAPWEWSAVELAAHNDRFVAEEAEGPPQDVAA